ncbi:abc-type mdr transport system, atpase component [hydrocarbon metagenome]|uniref:Abc-type mdr transport system, atpase component n=1 Tax=hydrocarbon metagenome TaxID=938273 RepID=A0A0W8E4I1_9ZZZZ
MDYTITTSNLTKTFGSFTAVDDINLKIQPGEICAFLGPNGAGKTTAIRMLCGILEPSSGTGTVLGYDIRKNAEDIKQKLGYMSQKFSLYLDLSVLENLDFYAGIYRIPRKSRRRRIEEMIDLAGLQGRERDLVANLSQGFKQRLALSCAIISDPQVIILDEPTSGVSPAARRSFFNIIQEEAGRGKTIIVSTHFMDEAERCGQIAFFNEGKLLALDNPDNLKRDAIQGNIYKIEVENPVKELDKIAGLPGVMDASLHGRSLHVLLGPQGDVDLLRRSTSSLLELIEPTLEDVFLALARKRGRKSHEPNSIGH